MTGRRCWPPRRGEHGFAQVLVNKGLDAQNRRGSVDTAKPDQDAAATAKLVQGVFKAELDNIGAITAR